MLRMIFSESLVVSVETAAIIVSALNTRSSNINNDLATFNFLAIYRFNCFLCLRFVSNSHESKAFRSAFIELVGNNGCFDNFNTFNPAEHFS